MRFLQFFSAVCGQQRERKKNPPFIKNSNSSEAIFFAERELEVRVRWMPHSSFFLNEDAVLRALDYHGNLVNAYNEAKDKKRKTKNPYKTIKSLKVSQDFVLQTR